MINGVDKIDCFRGLALRCDEGLTLETSAFNFSTVANLPYQLS